MKKWIAASLILLTVSLSACGAAKDPVESTSVSVPETEKVTVFKPDDGKFNYFAKELPNPWVKKDLTETSSYFLANYGEGEKVPELTVSVYHEKSSMGDRKAKNLALAVQQNRDVEKINEIDFGGMHFYEVQYKSLLDENYTCYEWFGQSEQEKDGSFDFVNVKLDLVKDAAQFGKLKGVFDCLKFVS